MAASRQADVVGDVGNALIQRADELHGLLDPIAQKQRTTAVLRTDSSDIVGAGAKRDLSPKQREALVKGEVAAKAPSKHAEVTTMDDAAKKGEKPQDLGASRDICDDCKKAIEASGGKLTSPRSATWRQNDGF